MSVRRGGAAALATLARGEHACQAPEFRTASRMHHEPLTNSPGSARSTVERVTDFFGEAHSGEWFAEQVHVLIEAAVMDDRVAGVSRGEQHP